jgi:hypothetical protein
MLARALIGRCRFDSENFGLRLPGRIPAGHYRCFDEFVVERFDRFLAAEA